MKTNLAPPKAWVFACLHACWCIRRMQSSKPQCTPCKYSGGDTPDISALQFKFYEPLLYLNPESSFPNSSEACGRFLGIAENVGDCMTYWILTKKKTVIARSTVRPLTKEDDVEAPQLEGGYKNNVFHWDEKALIEPLDPIHEVKCETEDNTHQVAEEQSETPGDYDLGGLNEQEEHYFDKINARDLDIEETGKVPIKEILAHRRLGRNQLELKVEYLSGDEEWIPMDVLKQDHPEIIAKYAKQKNLFRVHGFRWCKPFLKGINKIAYAICYHSLAYVRKSKRVMRELKTKGRRYKYGIALPKDVEDAMYVLDKEEGNQLWKESIKLERDAFEEAKVFRFLPPGARAPKEYKCIPVFMMYDIKQDLRCKSHFVAGGHVMGPPIAEQYASVVRT